jgi:hypothetical protein
MKEFISAVAAFLSNADFEVTAARQPPIVLVAQNQSVIVFVIDASGDIPSVVDVTIGFLIRPFRAKTFGPKTLEMYAVFLCDRTAAASDVERYEQNTMVCRKIFLMGSQEIDSRLSFLKPLEAGVAGILEIEQKFWTELNQSLSAAQTRLLSSLAKRDMSLKDFANEFGEKNSGIDE